MNKKILLAVAGVMVVSGIVMVLIASAMGASHEVVVGNRDADYYSKKKVSGTVEVSEFDTLKIDASTIELHIEEGDEYKIEYYTYEKFIPEVSQDGKNLTIKQPDDKSKGVTIGLFKVKFDEESKYKITVPKDCAPLQVDIRCKADDIVINGVDMNGKVISDSDDIDISNIVSGDLYLKSSAGEINVSNSELDKLEMQDFADDIHVKDCTINDLTAKSSSDAVKLENVGINTADIEALDDISLSLVGENDYSLDLDSATREKIVLDDMTVEGSYKSDNSSGKKIKAYSNTGKIKLSFSGK